MMVSSTKMINEQQPGSSNSEAFNEQASVLLVPQKIGLMDEPNKNSQRNAIKNNNPAATASIINSAGHDVMKESQSQQNGNQQIIASQEDISTIHPNNPNTSIPGSNTMNIRPNSTNTTTVMTPIPTTALAPSPSSTGLMNIANAAVANARAGNPTDIDVIFGRGEPTRKHPGNIKLRELVHKHLDEYMKSTKTEKTSIIRRVIREIDDSGARYLVPLDPSCRQSIFYSGCREARKSEVRSKVSHAFRDGERRKLLLQERCGVLNQLDKSMTSRSTPIRGNNLTSHPLSSNASPMMINERMPPYHPTTTTTTTQSASTSSSTPTTTTTTTADPLLSFANILSSLGNDKTSSSSPSSTAPWTLSPGGSSTRLAALSNFAASSLSAIEHKEKTHHHQHHHMNGFSSSSLPAMPVSKAKKKRAKPKAKAKASTKSGTVSVIAQSLQQYCQTVDIVFGRGAPLRQHPGNIKFRSIVAKYSERYLTASKQGKTEIIQSVIKEIEETGARFLLMNEKGSGVKEATIDEIRMKVSHRFRDFPKSKSLSEKKGEQTQEDKHKLPSPQIASSSSSLPSAALASASAPVAAPAPAPGVLQSNQTTIQSTKPSSKAPIVHV